MRDNWRINRKCEEELTAILLVTAIATVKSLSVTVQHFVYTQAIVAEKAAS